MRHIAVHTVAHWILAVACSLASGDVHHVKTVSGNVVSYASGVSVAKSGDEYVLVTAGHAYRGRPQGYAGIKGKWIPITLKLAVLNANEDYAICTFRYSGNIHLTKISSTPPRVGEDIQSMGIAENSETIKGRVTSVSGSMVYSNGQRHKLGMSGGAVIRVADRTLLGVISGYGSDGNVWTSATVIQAACIRLGLG